MSVEGMTTYTLSSLTSGVLLFLPIKMRPVLPSYTHTFIPTPKDPPHMHGT